MTPFYFFTLFLARHKDYIYMYIYVYIWLHIYKMQIYLCEVPEQPKWADSDKNQNRGWWLPAGKRWVSHLYWEEVGWSLQGAGKWPLSGHEWWLCSSIHMWEFIDCSLLRFQSFSAHVMCCHMQLPGSQPQTHLMILMKLWGRLCHVPRFFLDVLPIRTVRYFWIPPETNIF